MIRMPLNQKSVMTIINRISDEKKISVIYPLTLSITIKGKPSEIREIMESLVDEGLLERYKSQLPFVHCIIGYGYYKQ